MTLAEFERDDRFGVIDNEAVGCPVGSSLWRKQVCMAADWMLDPENSVGFDAVLDPDDMTVATLEDGHVVWTPLAEFEG